MHREAIPEPVWRLLLGLTRLGSMQLGYLAGGTGLAIQLGHRVSEDLAFFFAEGLEFGEVVAELDTLAMSLTVTSQTGGHCELMINAIKVDLIRQRISLRLPLKTLGHENSSFKVADPVDIARMKLIAISSRGGRKDFVDLYCLTRAVLPLEELLELAVEEHKGLRFNRLLFLKGLIDFEEADLDAQPILLWNAGWEEIKADLTEEVKRLAKKWS